MQRLCVLLLLSCHTARVLCDAETPEAIGWLIVAHDYAGMSVSFIVAACLVSRSTVYKILKLFRDTGEVVKGEGARGRPQKLTRAEVRKLKQIVQTQPTLYLDELALEVSIRFRKSVVPSTICRYLQRAGFTRKRVGLTGY